jgi:hypothetical protein
VKEEPEKVIETEHPVRPGKKKNPKIIICHKS